MHEAFSQGWADAWAEALRTSEAYRAAAASWEGAVGLVLDRTAESLPSLAVVLDLWHGDCRGATALVGDEAPGAAYVFRADRAGWRGIFEGGGSPVMALMTGRIRLVRGDLAGLLPYAAAARELLHLGSLVPTRLPEG